MNRWPSLVLRLGGLRGVDGVPRRRYLQRPTMGIQERSELYRQLEAARGRPLLVYVTSTRQNAPGQMAGDAVAEFLPQLQALPRGATHLDLLLISNGGDPTVALRIVSLVRERVTGFSVLIPEAAFSAATLLALGADDIVMHPYGHLGPVDPQIQRRRKDGDGGPPAFGAEDLSAFLEFAREKVGLSDQAQLLEVFKLFCADVGSVQVGVAARSSQLTLSMGERLLRLHMKGEGEGEKARTIAEKLATKFYHHGYPLGRSEAREVGLKVLDAPTDVEDLLWRVWLDLREELQLREPFSPLALLAADPNAAILFEPLPALNMPTNLPPPVAQQVLQAALQRIQIAPVAPTPYKLCNAVVESVRLASHFVTEGRIYGVRTPDLQLKAQVTQERFGWRTVFSGPEAGPEAQTI